MQHISPFWPAKRNMRHGLLNRLTIRFLCISTLFLLALSPRVGWAQTPEAATTFQQLRDKLLDPATKVITLSGTYEWDGYYNLKVNGTKTLNGGGSAVIKRKSGNPHGSIVLMDGATLNINGVTFDGQNVPSKASMIVANYNEDVSPYQYAAASLSMTDCTIKDCLLDYGTPKLIPPSVGNENYYYAIINTSGGAINFTPKNTNNPNLRTLTLQNSTFDNNRVTYLDSGSEVYNVKQLNGGAISVGEYTGTGTIQNCTFTGNKATHFGGAIAFWDMETKVTVTGCTIGTSDKPNIAGYTVANPTTFPSEGNGGLGGGIAFIGPLEKNDTGPKVDITNTAINYNIATGRGGGIYVMKSGSVQIGTSNSDNTTVNYNKVAQNGTIVNKGGGIYVNDHATITAEKVGFNGIDINGNQAANGGGIYIDGSTNQCAPKFEYCTIGASGNGNSALQNGGGIYFNGSQARFSNCTISYNSTTATDETNAQGRGGGIYKYGTSTLAQIFEDCQIHHNSALSGGGVCVTYDGTSSQPRTDFTRCEIYNNTATNNGGGLYFYYNLARLNYSCNVYGNRATNGGGIYMENGTIGNDEYWYNYEYSNNIYANTATQGGGIYYQFGTFKATNFVYDNTANEGGGVYVNPIESVTSVTLLGLYVGCYYDPEEDDFLASGNKAKNGGGIYTNPSGTATITLDDCRISYNELQGDNTTLIEKGGGLYMHNGKTHTVELTNSTTITANKAQNGGGVYIDAENRTLKLTHGSVFGNTAETNGGGIYNNYGKVVCESGLPFYISYNNATNGHGGGIYTAGLLDIQCTDPGKFSFDNNKALNGHGGGIYYNVVTGTSTLAGLTFTRNQANQNGGGIYLMLGNLILDDIQIKQSSASNGGGVYNNGTLTLTGNTTFDNNQTTGNGGGLYNNYKKTTTIESATFKDNKAPSGHGGGIYNYGTVEGNNSTVSFTGNTATNGNGGGICNLNILNLAEMGTKTFTGNTAKNGGGIYNDSIKYNEPSVVPPPPITLKKQIKAPGANNFNNGPITDEQLEGRVRLYYSYHFGNSTSVVNVDSLVLFYDSEHGGYLGINAYRMKPGTNQTYHMRMYAVYTPTQDEIDDGYGTEYRLYVSAKKLDADDSVNIGVSSTSYNLTVNGVSNITFPTTYPGGMEGTNYVGNTGANKLNSTSPQSINLAGMANLSNCVMGGSAAEANKATAGHGGAIYIDDASTANLENSSIMNNEAALFGGGVYICTNGIMGVKGKVTVSGNTSTRTDHNAFSKGSAGAWDDDVCLQTISKQSKDPEVISHLSGKIKVLDDITHSKIGITEEEITEGTTNEGTRREDDHGDYNRQFTIDYYKYHDDATVMALFFSNDNVLDVIPLYEISEGEEYVTTTGKLEVTLGIQPYIAWYVAGIVDDGNLRWGDDNNSGLAPDVPCRTLTGPNGIFARGYNPNNHKHHVFVVRSISIKEEALVRTTTINGEEVVVICYPHGDDVDEEDFKDPDYEVPDDPNNTSLEVRLHRYSGGHRLSNGLQDDGGGTVAGPVAGGSQKGPGANVGPIVQMNAPNKTILRNIEMDGLSEYDGVHNESHNPATKTFDPTSAVLAVEEYAVEADGTTLSSTATGTITLKEECRVALNNNKDGISDNSGSPDNKREERPGGGVYNAGTLVITGGSTVEENVSASHGGGVYVKKGLVTLEGDGTAVKDNDVTHETNDANGGGVYIDADGTLTVNGSGTKGVMIQHNTAKTHGGGVYKLGTLNVQGMVTITHNEKETALTENVYIPAAAAEKHILITDELACGSSIGVTKTKYWNGTPDYGDLNGDGSLTTADDGDHTYINDDNFTEVRTVIAKNETANSGHAWDAYGKDVFFDDKDCYTVWCFEYQNEEGGNYDSETPSATAYQIDNCYFIETWRSYADDGDDHVEVEHQMVTQVKTPQGLAYFAKHVNDGHSYDGASVLQEANINLDGHYWEPIGYEKPQAACDDPIAKPFSGSYDGQGHLIFNAYSILPAEDMGLFGTLTGTVKHTFAIGGELAYTHVAPGSLGAIAGEVSGTIDGCEAAGFKLFGYADNASAGGIAGITSGEVRNSFTSGITYSGNPDKAGGLVGYITSSGAVKNCYSKAALPNVGTNKGILVGTNDGELKNAYTSATTGAIVGNGNAGVRVYSAGATGATATYTPTIGADHLGYMCIDNGVNEFDKTNLTEGKDYFKFKNASGDEVELIPLFRLLSLNAKALNGTDKYLTYAEWARPALAYYEGLGETAGDQGTIVRPINDDLPLLMLNNYEDEKIGLGGFRSVGTYGGPGDVLQYGGPARDSDELNTALTRTKKTGFSGDDFLFVYGDITKDGGPSADVGDFTQAKVSIYEHAAIVNSGTLADFDNTYVGITFDNSSDGLSLSSEMNGIGSQLLPRDWHLFSSPISSAPMGFRYGDNDNTHNKPVSGHIDYNDTAHDADGYYNNPWGGTAGNSSPNNPSNTEFSWLGNTSYASGHNRYWMHGWEGSRDAGTHDAATYPANTWQDGYFPSKVNTSAIQFGEQLFIKANGTNGSNEYLGEDMHRYPYGMDLYSWYEPEYHYINFKRNGPNHWHSDEPHVHLDYKPEKTTSNSGSGAFVENQNETTLLDGKGYMASIHIPTFLQTKGKLSTAPKKIDVTNTKEAKMCKGWQILGNPYHSYLDLQIFHYHNRKPYIDPVGGYYQTFFLTFVGYNQDKTGFTYFDTGASSGSEYYKRHIHPHQGFFAKVSSRDEGQSSEYTAEYCWIDSPTALQMSLLRSEINYDNHFRDEERPAYPLVNLYLTSDKGCSDVTVVEFNRPESGGAVKMRELYLGNGVFYAYHDNENYASLYATPEVDRVPLKFEPKDEAGDTYTISWNTHNGDFSKLFLVDNLTGVKYDMLRSSSYSFTGKKGDYYSRFYITFDVTGVDEYEDNEDDDAVTTTFAFFDGNSWVVTNTGQGLATLELIDLQGRVMHSTTIPEGQARIGLPAVSSGMYLMRLNNEKGTKVQKVMVR